MNPAADEALSRYTHTGFFVKPMIRPPTAGPAIDASSNALEFQDVAVAKIPRGTRRGTIAARAGFWNALADPVNSSRAYITSTEPCRAEFHARPMPASAVKVSDAIST